MYLKKYSTGTEGSMVKVVDSSEPKTAEANVEDEIPIQNQILVDNLTYSKQKSDALLMVQRLKSFHLNSLGGI